MTDASDSKRDFFVSYTSGDEPWAEWLVWVVEEAGWSAWFQKWDFRGNFVLQMDRSNELSDRTIGILSARALGSKQVQAEWDARRAVDPRNERESLILIKVEPCEAPGLLKPFIWLDLTETDQDTAKAKLVAWLRRQRRKPDKAPQFPSGSSREKPTQQPRFPGTLPPVWNLPHRNPHFTGREELIQQLRAHLTTGTAIALTQTAAIHGLGGVGKTQLALEYAYRWKDDYDVAWWMRAEDPVLLASDCTALARALKLDEKDAREQAIVIAAVRRWLETHGRWLLVYDNAEDPKVVRGRPEGGSRRAPAGSDRACPYHLAQSGVEQRCHRAAA